MILPFTPLAWVFTIYRLLAVGFVLEILLPTRQDNLKNVRTLFDTPKKAAKHSLEVVASLQEKFKLFWEYAERDKRISVPLALLVMFMPKVSLVYTQYLAGILLAYCSYRLGCLLVENGLDKLSETPVTDESFREPVDDLTQNQMKLVSMVLLNLITFIDMLYWQKVLLITILPMAVPFVADLLSRALKSASSYAIERFPIALRDYKVGALLATLLALLFNYKYEQYIIHFLLAMYSSVVIGQVTKSFYDHSSDKRDVTSDDVVDLLYNADLVLAFWGACLLYEVDMILPIPRIVFIVLALAAGWDINFLNNLISTMLSGIKINITSPITRLSSAIFVKTTGGHMGCDQTPVLASPFSPSTPVGRGSHSSGI